MVCCSVHLFSHVLLPWILPVKVQSCCWESVVRVSHPVSDINPSNYLGELHLPWQQKLRVHGCCVSWAAGCKLKWLLIWGKPDSPWSSICGCRCSSLRTDAYSTGIYNFSGCKYAKGRSRGDKTVTYTGWQVDELTDKFIRCEPHSPFFYTVPLQLVLLRLSSRRQNISHF